MSGGGSSSSGSASGGGSVRESGRSDYRIKAVNKDEVFPAVYAVTEAGFGVSVSFCGKGQAFLEADSPCVEESKVAPPTAEPNGPSYEGVYPLPRPRVRSGFWSGSSN
ncbi:hypothetical protein SJX93_19210 [Streptomyces cyaneofuscatus]|nr:hypothetical protein [Streptomyces cyaneofuscatus]WRO11594.1 hypothetical protein SJX93_19210 [Streptomyces cyaneofuscatus]